MAVRAVSENDRERLKISCPACGMDHMRRVPRSGFWQRQVFSRVGYYPWECATCRKAKYFRLREKRTIATLDNSADL
jgi:hypothetical protein